MPASSRLALFSGASIYLLGHAAFQARMLGTVRHLQLALSALCLVLFAVSGDIAARAVSALLALALLTLLAAEARSVRVATVERA